MKVLGIDTSAVVCSVALVSDDETIASKTLSDGLTHSETLLPLVKEILEESKTMLSDLDGIAISHGPGSFTGLRIGISAVKGLAISHGIPCIGVSTIEALAMNAIDFEGTLVCPVMDARRGEFYNGLFRIENGNLIRLCEDRAIPGEAIAQELTAYENVMILGDGSDKFIQQNSDFSECIAPLDLRYQSGCSVAKLGLRSIKSGISTSCTSLSPKYLRLPQAEREWNERNNKKLK